MFRLYTAVFRSIFWRSADVCQKENCVSIDMILHAKPKTDRGLGVILLVPKTLLLVGVHPRAHTHTHKHKELYCYCLCAVFADLFFSLMFFFLIFFLCYVLLFIFAFVMDLYWLALAIVFLEGWCDCLFCCSPLLCLCLCLPPSCSSPYPSLHCLFILLLSPFLVSWRYLTSNLEQIKLRLCNGRWMFPSIAGQWHIKVHYF